jgi:hypothetical protein
MPERRRGGTQVSLLPICLGGFHGSVQSIRDANPVSTGRPLWGPAFVGQSNHRTRALSGTVAIIDHTATVRSPGLREHASNLNLIHLPARDADLVLQFQLPPQGLPGDLTAQERPVTA